MPDRLPNNPFSPASGNIFQPPSGSANVQQPRGGVRQDKGMPKFQRVATKQPDPLKTPNRAPLLNNDVYRSQKSNTCKLRAEKATTWLHPLVKKELERTAGLWGVSLSKVMATALEEWV